MKNGSFLVESEVDFAVDSQVIAKSINQIPCHLSSYILGNSMLGSWLQNLKKAWLFTIME